MNDNKILEQNLFEYKRKRKKGVLGLIIIIIFLGIGFASLQALLNVSGTTSLKDNTWSVHWDNATVWIGSVMNTPPTFNANKTIASFEITLSKPGDYYDFTIEAVNDGTLDAVIENIERKIVGYDEIPAYLDFEITSSSGAPIQPNQLLYADDSEPFYVKVEYKQDISADELPETDQSLSLQIILNYKQADNTAREKSTEVFTLSGDENIVGEELPDNTQSFDNYSDTINAYNSPVFLKHNLSEQNVVTSTSIVLVKNDNLFYINNIKNKRAYEKNIELLTRAFGSENCSGDYDTNEEGWASFRCHSSNDNETISAEIYYDSQILEDNGVGISITIHTNNPERYIECHLKNNYPIYSYCEETIVQVPD